MSASQRRTSGERTLAKASAETWQRILEASVSLFAERGFDAVSLDEISERAGIPRGSIYHFITKKEDLRAALMRDFRREIVQAIDAVSARGGSGLERLEAMLREHLNFICRHHDRWRFYLEGSVGMPSEARAAFFSADQLYSSRFEPVIAEAQAEGAFLRTAEIRLIVVSVFAALDAVPDLIVESGDVERGVDQVISAFIRGHRRTEA